MLDPSIFLLYDYEAFFVFCWIFLQKSVVPSNMLQRVLQADFGFDICIRVNSLVALNVFNDQ